MRKVLVRYKVKPDRAEENVKLVEAVYAELKEKKPAGLRYTTLKSGDGLTFFHLASIESSEGNPLGSMDAFKKFQENIKDRCDEPPAPTDLSLVGAYGFFDE
jgi:translation elongation factor EF-1beta